MTGSAVQLLFSGVNFMAEGKRLLRRRSQLLCGIYGNSENARRRCQQSLCGLLRAIHKSPLRICSAIYSDARIDNARIVIVGF